jgi:hypothetical protein
MIIEYEWLTPEQVISELESGNEIFNDTGEILKLSGLRINFTRDGECNQYSHSMNANFFKEKALDCSDKFRKPLTAERIIKSGTPLLAVTKRLETLHSLDLRRLPLTHVVLIKRVRYLTEEEVEYVDSNGFTRYAPAYKFITNKNGNYLTINENGEWSEVRR